MQGKIEFSPVFVKLSILRTTLGYEQLAASINRQRKMANKTLLNRNNIADYVKKGFLSKQERFKS